MLKLRYTEVTDWCQHRHRRIEFSPGTTVLLGPNGCGKSNLLHAAFNCLTGDLLTDDTVADNINWQADETTIETGFTIDGVDGVVGRKYIAPRVCDEAGQPVGTEREKHKTKAWLKFGDEKKLTAASKVKSRLAEILGLSSMIVRDHVIVPQGKLRDLLFQQKQERIKTFQSLVPALTIVEKKRKDIRTELERNPPISLGRSRDEIQKALDEAIARQAEVAARVDGLGKQMAEFGDVSGYRKRISDAEAANVAAGELVAVQARKETQVAEVARLREQAATQNGQIETLVASVEAQRPRADEVKRVLAVLETNAQAFTARQQAEQQLEGVIQEKTTKVAPAAYQVPDWFEKAVTDQASLAASVAAAEKVLVFLQSGKTKCPTCGTQFQDLAQQKAYQEQVLAQLRPSLQQHNEAVQGVRKAQQEAITAKQEFDLWWQRLDSQEQQLRTSLERLPTGEPADEAKRQAWQAELDQFTQLSTSLDALRVQATQFAPTLANAEAQLVHCDKEIARLTVASEGQMAEVALTSLRTELSQAEEARRALDTGTGELNANGEEIARLERQLDSIETDKTLAVAVDKYRGMLEHTYTVLHRDQLPQEVMMSYLGDLNLLCAKYLDIFGIPFAVSIPRDFDITVTRPDGYTCQASRESGGRQAALSIVFRFAINQLFASQVGLVALDEPTAYLDEDNLAYVSDIVNQMHRVESETGLQIVMITHEKSLVSAFDRVEDIG